MILSASASLTLGASLSSSMSKKPSGEISVAPVCVCFIEEQYNTIYVINKYSTMISSIDVIINIIIVNST